MAEAKAKKVRKRNTKKHARVDYGDYDRHMTDYDYEDGVPISSSSPYVWNQGLIVTYWLTWELGSK